MTVSLEDFAARERARRYSCSVCDLPTELREKIEAARGKERPISFAVLSKYLREHHGVAISSGAIGCHFRNGHS